jgi:hypothetical protein
VTWAWSLPASTLLLLQMNRRDLFRAASAGLAGAVGIHASDENSVPPISRDDELLVARDSDWQPRVLDAHQNETTIALAEQIIPRTDTPGASDAKVNRYIDLFLERDDELRRGFVAGLNSLDGRALEAHGVPFTQCAQEQQSHLLASLESDSDGFFSLARTLVARIYYNTPQGFQELNKFGVPRSPGCEHGSHG